MWKKYILYLSLYKILQRFIGLNLFKFENDGDKTEFEQMLHFMVNLSGKFRFKKTKFDLSGTQTHGKYKFGGQITTEGKYRVSTEYETDISFEYFQKLTQKIIEFEEFEEKIRKIDYKFNDEDINKIIEYLLDGRFFYDDIVEKILKDKNFSNALIEQAKKIQINDEECCYASAYEILVNDYFNLLDQYDCIDKDLLSHANLIKYFNNDKHKSEILDLESNLILELELFDKLDTKTINGFLKDQYKKLKMIKILKLVIGKLNKEKLNNLDFDNFDDELLSTVVFSKLSDISNDKIAKINFGTLKLNAQKLLFKKMADNNFEDFDLNINWEKVSIEVFKSASVEEWRKFVFKKILDFCTIIYDDCSKRYKRMYEGIGSLEIRKMFCQRQDILKLMPVNILSLFDTRKYSESHRKYYTFFSFFDDCFDFWSAEQILTFGRCRRYIERKSKEKNLKDRENSTGAGVDADRNLIKSELKKL